MSEALLEPTLRDDSRLALPLLAAFVLHVAVVLGVRLTPAPQAPPRFAALEVMLVPAPVTPLTPAATAEPPLTTLEVPPPTPVVAAPPVPAPSATRPPATQPPRSATDEPGAGSVPPPPPAPDTAATMADAAPGADSNAAPPAPKPLPSAAQLIARSFAIASTGAGLIEDRTLSGQPESQRTAYVSSATRDFALIAYKSAWFDKVSKLGNINYPEQARREKLSGRLQLDVAILADGSLKSVSIKHSSGFDVLDDAAVRIVELAAPYAPFPPATAERYDVIHMTNWWRFEDGAGFTAQD